MGRNKADFHSGRVKSWAANGGQSNPSTSPNLNNYTPDSWSHTDGKSYAQAQGDADNYNSVKWDD